MVSEEIRKGPWTEHEDLQLVCFVSLFGERRWDFIAKVSGLSGGGGYYIGLKRTGKSCRLRWFNYLHPGLKHGRMTSQEERLILELHSEWGNRWSRIAGRLPGRTDNEIKNYWRTHMRKKAQERNMSSSLSASTSTSSNLFPVHSDTPLDESPLTKETWPKVNEDGVNAYPMEQIWNDIPFSESSCCPSFDKYTDEGCTMSTGPPPTMSPVQEQLADLWMMDG